jgi:hypothetical protein
MVAHRRGDRFPLAVVQGIEDVGDVHGRVTGCVLLDGRP